MEFVDKVSQLDQLGEQFREVVQREHVRSVTQRVIGIRMRLEEHAIATTGDGRPRQKGDGCPDLLSHCLAT